MAHPFQVITICSTYIWLYSVAQGGIWSRDPIRVWKGPHQCLSACYYRSFARSQFCPVNTGSSKDHFFHMEDKRLYELHDLYNCHHLCDIIVIDIIVDCLTLHLTMVHIYSPCTTNFKKQCKSLKHRQSMWYFVQQ